MASGSHRLPPKKDVAYALLEGPSLFMHLDPRRPGVIVPKWLLGQPQLVLQVGLNMPIQIPDLAVDDEGISCTLSFNRTPFWCKVPWSAIYALVGEDSRGMVWPSDVPPEVATQMQAPPREPPLAEVRPAPEAPAKAKRSKKAAAKTQPSEEGEAAKSPTSTRATGKATKGEKRPKALAADLPAESAPAALEPAKPAPPKRSPKAPSEAPKATPVPLPRPRLVPDPPAEQEPLASPTPVPPPPAPRMGGPAKKVRRPLPDYLRVVK